MNLMVVMDVSSCFATVVFPCISSSNCVPPSLIFAFFRYNNIVPNQSAIHFDISIEMGVAGDGQQGLDKEWDKSLEMAKSKTMSAKVAWGKVSGTT